MRQGEPEPVTVGEGLSCKLRYWNLEKNRHTSRVMLVDRTIVIEAPHHAEIHVLLSKGTKVEGFLSNPSRLGLTSLSAG
jgi:hypothetical protein